MEIELKGTRRTLFLFLIKHQTGRWPCSKAASKQRGSQVENPFSLFLHRSR